MQTGTVRNETDPCTRRGGPYIFCEMILQRDIVEHGVSYKPLQLGVSRPRSHSALGLRHVHAAVLRLPGVEHGTADPVLPADIAAVETSASCSRSTAMICSSLNLDRFMVRSFFGPDSSSSGDVRRGHSRYRSGGPVRLSSSIGRPSTTAHASATRPASKPRIRRSARRASGMATARPRHAPARGLGHQHQANLQDLQ